jgi:TPR repeat protein
MPDVTDDKQAIRRESPDKGKLRVFISYSRDDQDFTDQLDAALDTYGYDCVIDRHGIAGGEDWRRRLGGLISEADTVVFVVSPTSARSETCAWEVEQATRLGKRILPIICRPLENARPSALLEGLNYIFFYAEPKAQGSGFGTGLQSLVAALNTDFDWLREHTRYLERALEWNAGGRLANRLLSGNDVAEAMAWVTRQPKSAPEPTPLQLDFIRASENEANARLSAERKQLEKIAAAQANQDIALQEREQALKEAASAQSKKVRVRNIALVAVSSLAILAGLLGWRAEERRAQANRLLSGATSIIVVLQSHMDDESKKAVFSVFETGAVLGDPVAMRNLGVSYANGIGVARDYDKAREWYEKAADQNSTVAMTYLGDLYRDGHGVEKDYAKARQLYEKAADKGDKGALHSLGQLYAKGIGVKQDYVKARYWYEKAVDKGDLDAMVNLGVLYASGHGMERDYAKARQWYERLPTRAARRPLPTSACFTRMALASRRTTPKRGCCTKRPATKAVASP